MTASSPTLNLRHAHIPDPTQPFLVVAVPPPVIADCAQAEQTLQFLQARVAKLPIVLIACNDHGAPTAYYGPGNLAIRLLRIPASTMRWSDLSLS